MSSKNKSTSPYVYSTNPDFKLQEEGQNTLETLPADAQKLKVSLDKKQRAGKAVTLISGFYGLEDDLEILGKKLKAFCGCGGSVKNGEIIVQGDNREKIFNWLKNNGYKLVKNS